MSKPDMSPSEVKAWVKEMKTIIHHQEERILDYDRRLARLRQKYADVEHELRQYKEKHGELGQDDEGVS